MGKDASPAAPAEPDSLFREPADTEVLNVYEVEVGVALVRPPTTQEIRKYMIAETDEEMAIFLAINWAYSDPKVSMPVYANLVL